jgi:hypothetical protein
VDDLKFGRTLWILSASILVVSGLYLFGYGGRFGLNVLEYIGVGDIVSHALMPFLAAIAFAVLGFAISAVTHDDRMDRLFPPGGSEAASARFVRRHWRPFAALYLVAIGFVAMLGPEPWRWYLVVLLTFPLATLLTHHDLLIALMPDPVVRGRMLTLLLAVATFSFAQGRVQADLVLNGAGPLLVDVAGSGLTLKSDAVHPVSYVGHVADFFVLYDSAQSQIVILNAQRVNSLALTKNPKAVFPTL